MIRSNVVLLILCLAAAAARGQDQPRPPADLVITNAKVWTVNPARPRAEALAVVGHRIAAVGGAAEIKPWIGHGTQVLDARGKTVLPGFIDAHVHFSDGGFEITGVQLRDAATPAEFARRIGEFAKKIPKGEWIRGGDWDHEMWGGEPPTRDWIDKVTPDNPVFVNRYDGHMSLANSLALRLAGVTRDTPTPAGGAIVKDAAGDPTGLLKDSAMGMVDAAIPVPSEEQRTRAIRAALDEARRFGVTSLDDISHAPDIRLYQKLLERGELTARIYCITPLPDWQSPARTGVLAGFGNDWIRLGAVKGFADGSLGSTTGCFFEPFNDAPNTSGLLNEMMFPEGNMLKMALGADRAGLQLAVHAIGDRANRIMLDVYAEVEKQDGPRDRRLRIEHAQHIRPQDFADFARLCVIASVQPYHAIDDGRWAEKRIGHERCKTTYAFRTFLDHGVSLAFGTDWTVAPLNPMLTLYAAVTRRTLDGKNPDGWFPEQKLTLPEAIEAYTMGSAYAEFSEKRKGSITPGKLADIVVLDSDLFALPPEQIKDAEVIATIVGGKVVYEAPRP
jgi:predicted amidohydrolase YtcJ